MTIYLLTAALLLAKFLVYVYYAGILNRWFEKTHNVYKISGVRLGLSLVLTSLNVFTADKVFMVGSGPQELVPFVLAFLLGALAWYIVLRIFYAKEHNKLFLKALLTGAVISGILGAISGVLALIGLLSTVNFC